MGCGSSVTGHRVALLMEGVDRNIEYGFNSDASGVALLMEGVDRNNTSAKGVVTNEKVALLMEGVDRNNTGTDITEPEYGSPSSWRAWIEILCTCLLRMNSGVALLMEGVDRNRGTSGPMLLFLVALLAEGVDRNSIRAATNHSSTLSPSSRRAWIEISTGEQVANARQQVALLAEGVDRNCWLLIRLRKQAGGRPPRGGRG